MSTPVPPEALWPLIAGARNTQLLYVAAKLRLGDRLAGKGRHSQDVASEVSVHPKALHRVMRGLVTVGVLAELEDGRFVLTPLGCHLRSGAPDSMNDWAIIWGELHHHSWGGLLHSVQTGRSALEHIFGMSMWDYLAQNPELAEDFNRAMASRTEPIAAAVLAAYDFSSFNRIVDVGGGRGAMVARILKTMPHMTGVLYDTAHVIDSARRLLKAEGVVDRCELLAGDFFVSAPNGGDIYLLKDVLHDWDDDHGRMILMQCRRAMSKQSRLLVVEMVMPERTDQAPLAVQMDLQMLIGPGGRKRSEMEHRELLTSAGLRLTKVIPTHSEATVLEAICSEDLTLPSQEVKGEPQQAPTGKPARRETSHTSP